jgi:hypothetical protein
METLLQDSVQQALARWLRAVSAACIALAVLGAILGGSLLVAGFLAPFLHCGLFWFYISIRSMQTGWLSESIVYIREKHPAIWKRLTMGTGVVPNSSFAGIAFMRDRLDDGTDEHLQVIKARMRRLQTLWVWPFALIPLCWGTTALLRVAVTARFP